MPTLYDGPEASSLVLIGDQQRSGMSIIPTSTPLTRLNYFDGKFLRADDMRLDQNYGRHLVALSVRGGGFGVVYGFELEPDDAISDRVQLRGGLAVAPSGRVIHLPSTALVSMTELIERSEQPFDPSRPSSADGGDLFAPCEPAPPPAPDVTVTETPIYVITIAPEEALCGEEERFGQLCADACLTETDRPRRVEGIRLRARPLSLTGLPVSTAVAFTSLHFRSRVATAYFAAEQRQLESLISGQGLQSRLWCLGAGAVEGNEVPIAIVARAGGVTTLLDGWTARRELMEQSARRRWTFRFSMRPWDIFLAQVLQFQCQLRELPTAGPIDPAPPQCIDERRALRDLSDVVAALDLQAPAGLDPAVAGKLKVVHDKAVEVLTGAGNGTPPSHGGFIARGFVTVPSAGYLPVSLTAELDVPAQVTAMFGPGVDLRFCAARSDVIPHLLEQAQHMERISLFAGLDDPARKEAVDVIVPDATFSDATTARYPTYFGSLRLMPGSKQDGSVDGGDIDGGGVEAGPRAAVVTGAALALRSVARNRSTGQGWTWAMAAYGEAPQGVAVERLFLVLLRVAGITGNEPAEPEGPAAPAAAPLDVPLTEDRILDERNDSARFVLAANRERAEAAERRARLIASAGVLSEWGGVSPVADRPLRRDEARPVALWFDVDASQSLISAAANDPIGCTMQVTTYSRASTNPILVDLRINGTLRVLERSVAQQPSGQPFTIVRTSFVGFLDPLLVAAGETNPPPRAMSTTMVWRFGHSSTGDPILLGVVDSSSGIIPAFEATLAAVGTAGETLRAGIGVTTPKLSLVSRAAPSLGSWMPAAGTSFGTTLALATMRRDDAALDTGSIGRDLAEVVVESIGAELTLPSRDPQFASRARALLYGETEAVRRIVASRDWVMFHRRRTIDCGGPALPTPVGVRRYRAFHAVLDDPGELASFERLLAGGGDVLDDLPFELITTVQFTEGSDAIASTLDELRGAWQSGERGDTLLWHAVGDVGLGDGEDIARRRLANYRGALSSLIDTSTVAPAQVLLDVPPEFTGPGTDGVLFTVGLVREPEPPDVVRSCQLLFRLTRDETEKLQSIIDFQSPELVTLDVLLRAMEEIGVAIDRFEADFSDGRLEARDTVGDWWLGGFGARAPVGALLLISTDADAAGLRPREEAETQQVLRVLRADFDPESGVIGDTGPCASIVLLIGG